MADKEYIERGALKNDFCNACSTHKRYHRTFDECRNKIDTDGNRCFKMRLIDNAPTADVVEVRRGRWLPQRLLGSDVVTCSECKTLGSPQWKWCPVCGADMRGETNDDRAEN